jgi:hypothetical protein
MMTSIDRPHSVKPVTLFKQSPIPRSVNYGGRRADCQPPAGPRPRRAIATPASGHVRSDSTVVDNWLVGARGGVATTSITGPCALKDGLVPDAGLVSRLPLFQKLERPDWSRFGARHELRDKTHVARNRYRRYNQPISSVRFRRQMSGRTGR